ncbi:hypothetical protein BDA99DRAFT_540176 [Phascolomyces articulosus]|uniref:Uncharacterized protein n=1 Tax=Phascolomyces articulosus TaxID=60185 RepID=A0AAD5JV71_9FUNG|nr:hypothetical protein BDA99DRAFT_540176 [Phascolomyces articulosus]
MCSFGSSNNEGVVASFFTKTAKDGVLTNNPKSAESTAVHVHGHRGLGRGDHYVQEGYYAGYHYGCYGQGGHYGYDGDSNKLSFVGSNNEGVAAEGILTYNDKTAKSPVVNVNECCGWSHPDDRDYTYVGDNNNEGIIILTNVAKDGVFANNPEYATSTNVMNALLTVVVKAFIQELMLITNAIKDDILTNNPETDYSDIVHEHDRRWIMMVVYKLNKKWYPNCISISKFYRNSERV